MQPTKSYRIWHSPRVGSSLLCQLLEDTGIAGLPGEHLSLHGHPSLGDKYGLNTYEKLRKRIWSMGTKDGIFAAKVSAHYGYHSEIVKEICEMRGIDIPEKYEDVWQDFFPDCKHIIIIRQNKLRQAVSWWKAIQDNEWHLRGNQRRTTPASFYQDKFDIDALTHLYKEATFIEASAQNYLAQHGLSALTVVYENLIADPAQVLNRCLRYLNLSSTDVPLPEMRFSKTADDHSEEWTARLEEALQAGWENKPLRERL